MAGRKRHLTREEIDASMPKPPKVERKYHYKEAFIMSPKLNLAIIQVATISDGINILRALGEGTLMVSTHKRDKKDGYFNMAKCDIAELIGKSEAEVIALLDKRTKELTH
jgi:hypothetical protein